jgi:hypothetical protein
VGEPLKHTVMRSRVVFLSNMIINLTFLSVACLTLIFSGVAEAKEWRGLVPLHSTRSDMEKLLGKGSDSCHCGYYLNDLNVFFVYSSGSCKSGGSGGWNIPSDTVIRFSIYPKVRPKLSELKLDFSKFKNSDDPELVGNAFYMNEEEGIGFEVDVSGIVMGFYYEPAAKDKTLRCSHVAHNKRLERTRHERASLLSCVGESLSAALDAYEVSQK